MTHIQETIPGLDPVGAEAAKAAGMEQVAKHSKQWRETALRAINVYKAANQGLLGSKVPQDDIRAYVEKVAGRPHHPNAWGPLFKTACKAGLLIRLEAMQPSRIKSSHGRLVPCYDINGEAKKGGQVCN